MAWEGKLWTEGSVHYYLLGPGGQPSLTTLFAYLARYHGEQAAEDQCGEHRGESPGFSRDSLLFRCFHQPEHWGSNPLSWDSLSKRQQWKAISSAHQRKRHCGGNKGEYLYVSGWQHSTNAISTENYNIYGAAYSPAKHYLFLLLCLILKSLEDLCHSAFVRLTRGTFAFDAGPFHLPTPIYSLFTAIKSLYAVT